MKSSEEYEQIFTELRKKHGVSLPNIKNDTVPKVSFAQNDCHYTYVWVKNSVEWKLFSVPYNAPEPSNLLEELINADIITKDGKVNFIHKI